MQTVQQDLTFAADITNTSLGLLLKMNARTDKESFTFEDLTMMAVNDTHDTVKKALKELTAEDKKYVICINGRYAVNRDKLR